jgi:uncharacterized protein (UPF0248 family)
MPMRHMRSLALFIALSLAPVAATGSLAQVGQPEVRQAESAMTFAARRADAVRRLKQVPSVGVIRLDTLRHQYLRDDGFDISELYIYAEKHAAGISRLRTALNANPVTRGALQSRNIPLHRVVGVHIGSNGALRIFIL